jgi:predicted TIM-barrel fold metal-dependent hydrolase
VTVDLNWMVSVDDHVIEPPDVWQRRLPERHRDAGPRLVQDDRGEAWYYEDKRLPTLGLAAAAGQSKEQFSPLPLPYSDMRPGCYDPLARVEDMNRSGVIASLCFPSFPRLCGQTFHEGQDKQLGLACVKAYNDFMIEEWCGSAPGRFIPLVIIPLWDPAEAAREIERTAAMGARAVSFSENPAPLGLPTIHDKRRYWDPVFDAASQAAMPLCTHFGSSSKLMQTSDDTPLIATIAMNPTSLALSCIDWLFSGVLERFPNLKICMSEGGIGWIPWVLERSDYTYDRQRFWASGREVTGDMFSGVELAGENESSSDGSTGLTSVPSDLFRQHIYGCFIDEPNGARMIDHIGVDNVMVEADYPHTDSSWPNSIEISRHQVAHLAPADQHKVLRGNAERLFSFTPAPPPVRLTA